MKYMLLLYAPESPAPETSVEAPAVAPPVWSALAEAMHAAGAYQASAGLSSVANATTVRIRDRRTLISDGPFAETHEQLGGFFVLDCQDLDEAIRWAEQIPTAQYGSIEIRPLWSPAA